MNKYITSLNSSYVSHVDLWRKLFTRTWEFVFCTFGSYQCISSTIMLLTMTNFRTPLSLWTRFGLTIQHQKRKNKSVSGNIQSHRSHASSNTVRQKVMATVIWDKKGGYNCVSSCRYYNQCRPLLLDITEASMRDPKQEKKHAIEGSAFASG